MPLTEEGLAPLFLPGTVALPSPFPSVGDIEIEEEGAKFHGVEQPGGLLIVRRRIEPSTKVCWTILVERVSAILLTSDGADPRRGRWLFGPSVAKLRPLTGGSAVQGIAFVPEDTPVLIGVEFGTTASESTSYAIPGLGGCDPCDQRPFSYKNVVPGPDQGPAS